jgi:hypothetical protein
MNGMDEQQRKINDLMANPKSIVSDAEVRAAEDMLVCLCAAADKEPPIPAIFIRHMLTAAALARAGALSFTNGDR